MGTIADVAAYAGVSKATVPTMSGLVAALSGLYFAASLERKSVRQVERLCRKLRLEGARGLVSKKRGRASNRRLPEALRERALGLIRSRYVDFGPTLAAEKLSEPVDGSMRAASARAVFGSPRCRAASSRTGSAAARAA